MVIENSRRLLFISLVKIRMSERETSYHDLDFDLAQGSYQMASTNLN
jgi:hypothetical protein